MTDTKEIRDDVKQSMHRVWLAGLGALSTAEEEGSKLFRTLVDKGSEYEKRGKQRFGNTVDEVKSRFEQAAEKARGQAGNRWERVEERIDDAVGAALRRAGVPTRDEIATLTQRVEELTAVVEKLRVEKAPAKKAAAKKATSKTATSRAKTSAAKKNPTVN